MATHVECSRAMTGDFKVTGVLSDGPRFTGYIWAARPDNGDTVYEIGSNPFWIAEDDAETVMVSAASITVDWSS